MSTTTPAATRRVLALAIVAAFASGCAVGPDYKRPDAPGAAATAYKESQDWVTAVPADALDRGQWWTLFNDPVLNDLQAKIDISNQNVAQAVAAYAGARALVREQRASLFPSVTLDGSANRAGGGSGALGNPNRYQVNIGGSWEPDVWGRLGRGVEAANASAEASAADLASARLSAQGELATDYFSLRQNDAQQALLADTIAGYKRTMDITQNRYAAGIVPKTDVLQAQTQLFSAQAEQVDLKRQRAQLEHAIAVLVGLAPADFKLDATTWSVVIPAVPVGVPSVLLQRRPDIAGAERRLAAANAQIGVAKAGYFPSLNLSASYGSAASRVGDLFKAANNVWSLGLSAAQTLFDAGATSARVSGAQAQYDAAVAHYRQVVLTAFQDVEDQMAATTVLAQQEGLRRSASQAADQTEVQVLNRYRQGQVSFTDVVTAQATAFSARRTLVQLQADRQTTAVALIQSLGGGWHAQ